MCTYFVAEQVEWDTWIELVEFSFRSRLLGTYGFADLNKILLGMLDAMDGERVNVEMEAQEWVQDRTTSTVL